MTEIHERLQEARRHAGYEDAAAAARAMGVREPTYYHHENGTRGITRGQTAQRYARFFGVNIAWLLTGRGPMLAKEQPRAGIPIDGVVGAGARVELIEDPAGDSSPDEVVLPNDGTLGALIIKGDSNYPVFTDGEVVLYDRRPIRPTEIVGQLAVVQTIDGHRLLKTVRRGRTAETFRLISYNAPEEEEVKLLAAWRYIGALSHR